MTRPALAFVAIVALVGCTGGDDGGGASTGSASPTAEETGASLAPGEVLYRYVGASITAVVRFAADGTATLEVRSNDDVALAAPGLYALRAADGARVDLAVDASAPIPPGGSETFDVTLGDLSLDDVGMLVLLVGDQDLGGFIRFG